MPGNLPPFVATIRAGGLIYSSWESVTIRRDYNDGISSFSFSVAEGSYGGPGGIKLQPSDPVEIWLNREKVIQGTVTNRAVAFDKQTHQVVISGRSITDALAKSSIPLKPGSFDNSTLEQAVRGVLAPHNIGLVMKNAPEIVSTPFRWLSVHPGETVAEFVERIRIHRDCFVCDDADGNLVLGQGNPSAAPVADLVEGRNILSLSGSIDDSTAYGKISAIGQTPGNDDNYPQARASSASTTNSSNPAAHIALMVLGQPQTSGELAAVVNHANSESLWKQLNISVTVVGWFRPDGKLWQPTDNVTLYSPSFFPTQSGTTRLPLGIQSVIWGQDSTNGSTTVLTLVLRNGLSSRPLAGIPDATTGSKPADSAAKENTSDATPDAPDYTVST